METTLRTINAVISALFFICYTYQFLYIPLVLAKKPKPLTAPDRPHRYAVLIAARNEENVISGLPLPLPAPMARWCMSGSTS